MLTMLAHQTVICIALTLGTCLQVWHSQRWERSRWISAIGGCHKRKRIVWVAFWHPWRGKKNIKLCEECSRYVESASVLDVLSRACSWIVHHAYPRSPVHTSHLYAWHLSPKNHGRSAFIIGKISADCCNITSLVSTWQWRSDPW